MPTALVTGGNRGLGLELVRHLLQIGWHLIATARQPAASRELTELTAQYPSKLEILQLDVNDQQSIASLALNLKGRPIDLLLCSAGTNPVPTKFAGIKGKPGERIQDFPDQVWFDIFSTNMIGPLRVAASLHENVQTSDRKIMAFISTRMANIQENTSGVYYIYRASKAALNTAVRNLSLELADKGVACVALHPGWVRTDMGGPQADVSAGESASGLVNVLQKVTASDNGKFFDYRGTQLNF